MSNERVFKGFTQYRVDGSWRFSIAGFDNTYSGSDGYCSVRTPDGEKTVPIDKDDRILIAGKWYESINWIH